MNEAGIRKRRYGKTGRAYWIDGQKVQGVTSLIKEGMPAPALVGWGIRTVSAYAADHLEELWAMRGMGREAVYEALRQSPYTQRNTAGARGTEIHGYAERLARGEEVDVPGPLRPWVQSALDYLNDYNPKTLLTETPVGSRKWAYAGTLDDVSEFPDGKRRVVDYKTGNGVYADDVLQVAAYRNAEIYMDGEEEKRVADLGLCEEAYIVHIRPEGYRVFPANVSPDVHMAFVRVAWLARLRSEDGPLESWLGAPLQPPRH